jgi:23S rRNA pseudouridine2605 synthase
MARAGLCSRRDAELWIGEGRVSVNGKVLSSPALNVTSQDRIVVDGRPLAQRERTRLFLFNKPRGLVTTDKDPEGRPTIFEALPETMPRVISIGRLDINTEGLLLLTNDGGLARVLELPATGWLRRYRVRAFGETDQAALDQLANGVTIEGVDYRGIEARIDRSQGDNVWITMGLREGKNREIKRVLEHLGLQVNRLIRISYGPFQLAELGEGAIEEVRTRVLKDQLGEKLTLEAEADFDAPVFEPDADRTSSREREDSRGSRGGARGAGARGGARDRDERGGRGVRGAGAVDVQAQVEPHSPIRQRKHISTLREERLGGDRKRVTRTKTEDRRGREIPVERITPAGKQASAPPGSRNGRRFAGERTGEAPKRTSGPQRSGAPGGRPYRGDRAQVEPGEAARPARIRTEGADTRSFRRDARSERPSGDKPRFEKRDGNRPMRAPRGDGVPPRFDRPDRPPRTRPEGGDARPPRSSDRPARSFSDKPRFEKRDGDRPARAPRSEGAPTRFDRPDRPPRARPEGGDARPPRSSDRPARSFSDKPRFEKRDGAAPRFDRPDRPPRTRPEGGDARPPRSSDRPGRSFSDKPRFEKRDGASPGRPPRSDGGKPRSDGKPRFNRSERPAGGGDKPFRPRPAGDKPRTGGPARGSFKPGGGGGRSGGKPPSRGKR